MNFYVDESGNTGDLSRTNANLEFGGQPVFSLAAIGVVNERNLAGQLNLLRKKHNVQSNELKLSKILKRKPEFALEAVELMVQNGFPFFIEIVDKKISAGRQHHERVYLAPVLQHQRITRHGLVEKYFR